MSSVPEMERAASPELDQESSHSWEIVDPANGADSDREALGCPLPSNTSREIRNLEGLEERAEMMAEGAVGGGERGNQNPHPQVHHHHQHFFRKQKYTINDSSKHYHICHVHHHHYHFHGEFPFRGYNGWNGNGNVASLRLQPYPSVRSSRDSASEFRVCPGLRLGLLISTRNNI